MRLHQGEFADIAELYARKVLDGTINVCLQIKQAAARFLADVESEEWTFNARLVDRVCMFMELLVHTEGELAGQPFILEPFQIWILAAIFGLVDKQGYRKHREAFILMPRKNGKSTLAAGIAQYMLVADGEPGAQIYIGANSKEQANFCFKPCRLMALQSPGFMRNYRVTVGAEAIILPDGSFIKRLIGKPGDGSNPHLAILDEAHENNTSEQYDTMQTGMAARRQSLLLTITTAGTNTAGPCRELQLHAEQVLAGTVKKDNLFVAIYTIDKDDDWKDIEAWKKANPNYGVSFGLDKLEGYLADALSRPAKKVGLCTKHLNVWESSASAWLNMAQWDAAATAPPIADVKGRPAWIGIDLSTSLDMTAIVLLVRLESDKLAAYPYLFLPHAVTQNGKNASAYAQWVADEHVYASEGDAIDYQQIEDTIRAIKDDFDVQAIAYDSWQGHQMAQRLSDDLVPIYQSRTTFTDMDAPMKEMERLLATGEILHCNNPALNWMAGNICATGRSEQIRPVKPVGQDHLKIDGIVAALMALGLSMQEQPEAKTWELFVLS